MDSPPGSTDALTLEQRREIVELANVYSGSPRAPEVFVILCESWINGRVSFNKTAGFVRRKRLIEMLLDPLTLQALSKLLPRWVERGLVEAGPGGLRVGPKLREIVDRQVGRPGTILAPGGTLPGPAHEQPKHHSRGPHTPEILNATTEIFVAYATLLYAMPPSEVYRGLSNWKGPRSELADYLCGLVAEPEHNNWPKDPFVALDEMQRGVSRLKPMNAETFIFFKVKQIEAQRMETAQKAHFVAAATANFWNAFGPLGKYRFQRHHTSTSLSHRCPSAQS